MLDGAVVAGGEVVRANLVKRVVVDLGCFRLTKCGLTDSKLQLVLEAVQGGLAVGGGSPIEDVGFPELL
jgi:hypothetical protein